MSRVASAVEPIGCVDRDLHDGELVAAETGHGVGRTHA